MIRVETAGMRLLKVALPSFPARAESMACLISNSGGIMVKTTFRFQAANSLPGICFSYVVAPPKTGQITEAFWATKVAGVQTSYFNLETKGSIPTKTLYLSLEMVKAWTQAMTLI